MPGQVRAARTTYRGTELQETLATKSLSTALRSSAGQTRKPVAESGWEQCREPGHRHLPGATERDWGAGVGGILEKGT